MTQCLASPIDGIEDSARRLGPAEGFGSVHVVGFNETADLVSQFAHAGESAAPQARRCNWPNQVSTALSHDALVGVKCR